LLACFLKDQVQSRCGGFALLAATLILSTGCQTEPTDTAGYAYVAPASVNLRPALTDRSNTVALLHYGDRVQIVEVRRRFAKIRTSKGAEGWIDATQLLPPEQMEEVRRAAAHALALPSEGSATVFEALNIHLDPNRQSAAFAKIPDGGSVEVLAHKLEPKLTGPPKIPVFTMPLNPAEVARKERKEKKAKTNYRLPERPPAPKPPDDWMELSNGPVETTAPASKPAPKPVVQEPKKPVQLEDWTLVRTKDKQTGWVLTRNLIMSIPDEVAQYAEGKRITSYFDLGTVQDDEKGPHHNWLWTTASGQEQYDFDAWRVFLWNRRRHRFETSYREHDVEGYFPVHVDAADSTSPSRTFDLILRDDRGKLEKKKYNFDGVRVHLAGAEPYDPEKSDASGSLGTPGATPKDAATKPGWLQKLISNWKKRFSKAT
jgi:uncharacterized protein YgiM (DUF1202 family)